MRFTLKPSRITAAGLLAAGLFASSLAHAQDYEPYQNFDSNINGWTIGWGGQGTVAWDSAQDASDGTGAIYITADRALGDQLVALGWFSGGAWNTGSGALDLAGYTNVTFKVKWDPANSTIELPDFYESDPGEALLLWGIPQDNSSWFTIGTVVIPHAASNGWVTVNVPVNAGQLPQQTIYGVGFKKWTSTGQVGKASFWVDDIVVQSAQAPVPPPNVSSLKPAGTPGLQVIMGDNGNQWQRDAISTPADMTSLFWSGNGATPVTYSFTISDFPDPIAHEGFEAHIYIVNRDTSTAFDETYGGCDWNAPDIAIMSLQALTDGTFECQFQFKTNMPNANPPENPIHRPGYLYSPTIVGTWSISFTHDTNVTMSGPGGISTNFTIPLEAVQNNFSPALSFVQFGFHKNDNENDGHNNGVIGTFGNVKKTGGAATFDESFTGPTLTNTYAWRKTSQTYVQHVAPGVEWILGWTLPAQGFSPQVAGAVTGSWSDVTPAASYQAAGSAYAYINGSSIPAGDAAYFRLIKRVASKLQVLLPGETNAPGTPTGKTGTPDPITLGAIVPVTIHSVDADWNISSSTPHTVHLVIDPVDASNFVDPDAALTGGTATILVQINVAGTYTITATDVTDGTLTAGTSASFTVNP